MMRFFQRITIEKYKSQFRRIKFSDSYNHLLNDFSLKAVVIGNPGRIEGWMCECGIKLSFDEQGVSVDAKRVHWFMRR